MGMIWSTIQFLLGVVALIGGIWLFVDTGYWKPVLMILGSLFLILLGFTLMFGAKYVKFRK